MTVCPLVGSMPRTSPNGSENGTLTLVGFARRAEFSCVFWPVTRSPPSMRRESDWNDWPLVFWSDQIENLSFSRRRGLTASSASSVFHAPVGTLMFTLWSGRSRYTRTLSIAASTLQSNFLSLSLPGLPLLRLHLDGRL